MEKKQIAHIWVFFRIATKRTALSTFIRLIYSLGLVTAHLRVHDLQITHAAQRYACLCANTNPRDTNIRHTNKSGQGQQLKKIKWDTGSPLQGN